MTARLSFEKQMIRVLKKIVVYVYFNNSLFNIFPNSMSSIEDNRHEQKSVKKILLDELKFIDFKIKDNPKNMAHIIPLSEIDKATHAKVAKQVTHDQMETEYWNKSKKLTKVEI